MNVLKALFIALAPFLLCSALLAEQHREFKEVEKVSKPVYRERSSEAWKTHGRLVGQIENAPEKFSLLIYKTNDFEKPPYRTEDCDGALNVYESGWLLPGKYFVIIRAKGFDDYKIKSLEIKAGSDCIVDIVFGTRVFNSNFR